MTAPTTICPEDEQSALDTYDRALARAASGARGTLVLRHADGREYRDEAADWCRPHRPGDSALLDRCGGATLDVGCGPGRLTSALLQRGRAALGIDVSAVAVRLARARGALALRRDVFGPLPGHGRWEHLLLADGNIGIGGDPAALLYRCRTLIAPQGHIHAELQPPGTGSWSGRATLHAADGRPAAPLRWARLAADDLPAPARAAGLTIHTTWTEEGRWFATLTRTTG